MAMYVYRTYRSTLCARQHVRGTPAAMQRMMKNSKKNRVDRILLCLVCWLSFDCQRIDCFSPLSPMTVTFLIMAMHLCLFKPCFSLIMFTMTVSSAFFCFLCSAGSSGSLACSTWRQIKILGVWFSCSSSLDVEMSLQSSMLVFSLISRLSCLSARVIFGSTDRFRKYHWGTSFIWPFERPSSILSFEIPSNFLPCILYCNNRPFLQLTAWQFCQEHPVHTTTTPKISKCYHLLRRISSSYTLSRYVVV